MQEISIYDLMSTRSYQEQLLTELLTRGYMWYKITDTRSRWLNSIIKVDRVSVERARARWSTYGVTYSLPTDPKNTPQVEMDNFRQHIAMAMQSRPHRTVNKKYQELKYNTQEYKLLLGYEAEEETIVFEKPEDRVNAKDFLGIPITIGSTVMGCHGDTLFLGKVQKFRVGPQNVFARIDSYLPSKQYDLSINVKSIVVVNPDLGNNILLAKLTA